MTSWDSELDEGNKPNKMLDVVLDAFDKLVTDRPVSYERLRQELLPSGGSEDEELDLVDAIAVWCLAGIMEDVGTDGEAVYIRGDTYESLGDDGAALAAAH